MFLKENNMFMFSLPFLNNHSSFPRYKKKYKINLNKPKNKFVIKKIIR